MGDTRNMCGKVIGYIIVGKKRVVYICVPKSGKFVGKEEDEGNVQYLRDEASDIYA